jgi:hypothetical protein|tara:strand:+ start:32 stop:721 length:690 start_codon:yes stop_codon:yes gene_type:complete
MKIYLAFLLLAVLSNLSYADDLSSTVSEHNKTAVTILEKVMAQFDGTIGSIIIAIVGALLAWFGKVGWDDRQYRMDHDRTLFDEFILLLPSSTGAVLHLKEHDFGSSYLNYLHNPLKKFQYEWNQPEKEFLNKATERAMKTLLVINDEFLGKLGAATGVVKVLGEDLLMGIHDPNKVISIEHKQKRDQKVIDVNKLADRWVEAHHEFVKLANRKLLASESLSRQLDSSN